MRLLAAITLALIGPVPAAAQEVFGGVYAHEVGTPFTLPTEEEGVDLQLGYRFAPIAALAAVGKPAPYLIASLNTGGGTSFAGAGVAWTIGQGKVYLRPGVGIVVHDGPSLRVSPITGYRTDLGSRVLFEPELGLGVRLGARAALEAHWTHISHARLFNSGQNPGIDMIGLRFNYRVGK